MIGIANGHLGSKNEEIGRFRKVEERGARRGNDGGMDGETESLWTGTPHE